MRFMAMVGREGREFPWRGLGSKARFAVVAEGWPFVVYSVDVAHVRCMLEAGWIG